MTWRQHRGGKRWRVLETGYIEVERDGVIRTKGAPTSVRGLRSEYGDLIEAAAAAFAIPVEWIYGMIPIEAARLESDRMRFDPVSIRYEPGYIHPSDTPHRVSAGLMQTLVSTARQMAEKYELELRDMDGDLRDVQLGDLLDPHTSLWLGAAYMAHQRDRYAGELDGGNGLDFVYLTGAYNAGSVRTDVNTPFRLMTYSPTRTERAIRFHNDAVAISRGEP